MRATNASVHLFLIVTLVVSFGLAGCLQSVDRQVATLVAMELARVTPTGAAVAQEPLPTYTPLPTLTPWPTYTLPPTLTPTSTPTQTPPPTDTLVPTASVTPQPTVPTSTPRPSGSTQSTPKGRYPPPVLISPLVGHNAFNSGRTEFRWSWARELGADEYFQVQLIGPGGEHRGIHAPTKEYVHTADRNIYGLVTDWYNTRLYATSHWTVVVIRWDGRDPNKIGETLAEGEARRITL
jgi:hypothetical protein